jgi:choline kinase
VKVIILAAGQGFKLDGFNKVLLKDPARNKTILDLYLDMFPEDRVTVVVGYSAITIMNEYPHLDYVYNPSWRTTGSSYSLSLALDDTECLILPSDLFLDPGIIKLVMEGPENCVLVANTENRTMNSANCTVENGRIISIYQGSKKGSDPEIMGVYKISERELIRKWKKNCFQNKNLFTAQNLPISDFDIFAVDKGDHFLHEINTPLDYINFLRLKR